MTWPIDFLRPPDAQIVEALGAEYVTVSVYANLPNASADAAAKHASKNDSYILAILEDTDVFDLPVASVTYHVGARDIVRLDFENNTDALDDDAVCTCLDRAIHFFLATHLAA